MKRESLPSGWKLEVLGKLSSAIQYGYTAKAQPKPVGPRLLRITDIQNDTVGWEGVPYCKIENEEKRKYLLAPNDILFARTGATVGKSYLVRDQVPDSVFASYLIRVRLTGEVAPKYVAYFFKSADYWRQISESQAGIGQPNVNGTKLAQIEIPVAPANQQQRIVAEIEKQFSRLDEAVATLKRVNANLKRYKASILKAAVEGRLFDDCRKGVKGNDWVNKPIDVAIDSLDQGWSPQCDNEPSDRPDAWGVIKTTAVQSMRYLESENKRLPRALRARPKLELVPGDLLMTRAGPRSRVGVVCLVKSTRSHLMLCDKVYRIRCKPGVASPAFLELVLNAPNIVDELNQLKTGISDSGVNLTQKRLRELIIPLPSFKEQERVVAEVERRLSVIDELEASVEANLTRADRLRQSILSQAFSGKLVLARSPSSRNVPQDLPVAAEPPAPYGVIQ